LNCKEETMNGSQLRDHVLYLLKGGGAHAHADAALKGLSKEDAGRTASGLPYTLWQVLEHMRIAQWDILEFSMNAQYKEMNWPDEYWPQDSAPAGSPEFQQSQKSFFADLDAMQKLVANPETDLFAKIPWGEGQTILREALLVADHNAYHVGQIVTIRKILGIWPG
jgi:DinB superfamily